ncbi:hypothetical protein LIER_17490 [Lithospermum erythrorhizon]|uniref:Pentatricopeptide repeat-containing protein n=1 Tax=Lithospermum erythrorhizon TaxID=34254 RepID=A0AAV3QAI2_LITER
MQHFSILRNNFLCATIRRTLNTTSSPSHLNLFSTYFCTQTTYEEKETNASSLSRRIEKLPGGFAIGSAFQSWMGDGFPITRGNIFHIINRLRKLNNNKRAFQVMEWVIRERPYKPTALDYSFLLEFTTKLHGIPQGESLFSRIPSEFQNDLIYNNLVLACLEKGLIRLSLEYMNKMRELEHPISYLVFNRLIILHSSPSRKKFIPKILRQMKADKVTPHVSTYNILLKIEANNHNIDGLVKVFDEMRQGEVEPNEITFCILASAHAVARLYTACAAYVESVEKSMTGTNWSTLDILVILYGYLGNQNKLERIWDVIQMLPNVRSKSFLLVVEAYGRIGDYNRAEEIWMEMKSKKGLKSTEQFNALIAVYCKHAHITKATRLFKEMEKYGCSPNSITYRHLALGCLRAKLMKEAIKTLELGAALITNTKVKSSTPWLEATLFILEIFADHGDVENVEKLFKELKEASYTRYTFVYNILIKAYVKAKLYDPNLLKRMIIGGAKPDSETYSLIRLLEQFHTEDTG